MSREFTVFPLELLQNNTVPTKTKLLFGWLYGQTDKNYTAKINLFEMSSFLKLTRNTALNQLKNLVKLGYIEAEKDKENGNYYTIRIKEK